MNTFDSTTAASAPMVGLIELPELADLLSACGLQVVTGPDFKSAATAIRDAFKAGGEFPLITADVSAASLHAWLSSIRQLTQVPVGIVRAGAPVLDLPGAVELREPFSVDAMLAAMGLRPIGGPGGAVIYPYAPPAQVLDDPFAAPVAAPTSRRAAREAAAPVAAQVPASAQAEPVSRRARRAQETPAADDWDSAPSYQGSPEARQAPPALSAEEEEAYAAPVFEAPQQAWDQPAPVQQSWDQPVAPVQQDWNQPAPVQQSWDQPVAPVQQDWNQPAPVQQSWDQPAAPVQQEWNQPAPVQQEWNQPAPVQQDWNQPAPVQQDWNQPAPVQQDWNQPAPVQQSWDQPAAPVQQAWDQPAAPVQQDWNQPAPVQQSWDQPAAPVQQAWDQPAAPVQQDWNQPAPVQQSWDQPAAPVQQDWNQPAPVQQDWNQPAPVQHQGVPVDNTAEAFFNQSSPSAAAPQTTLGVTGKDDYSGMFDKHEASKLAGTGRSAAGLGSFIINYSGKGGVGKSTTSLQLARFASDAGMSVILIDGNSGQGDLRTYLRLNRTDLPTIYDAAIGDARNSALTPKVINENREENLGEVKFAFIAAPPDDINDPDVVTHEVYRRVIDFARRNADLVIMDTQIIESADRTGVVTQLILPALVHDAWGVGIADMTNVGVNNLNNRLRKFLREGVPKDRLMVMINKVHPEQIEMASKAVHYFTGRAKFLGYIEMDAGIHQDMNAGRIGIENAQMRSIMAQILFRVTGNEAFERAAEMVEPPKSRGKKAVAAKAAKPSKAPKSASEKPSLVEMFTRFLPGKKGE